MAIKRFAQMSAMRNALVFSLLFLVTMILAGIYLRFELADQIHEEIDRDLSRRAEVIQSDEVAKDGVPLWFQKFANTVVIGGSESFLTDAGEVIGPANTSIFEEAGFRTVSESQLFAERYFELKQIEFRSGHLSVAGLDDEHDDHEDEVELWRVFVTGTDGGTIVVYTSIHEVEDALELLPSIMLPITIATLFVTVASGVLLGLTQQTRISRIHHALKQIASGNLSFRIEPHRARDDLDELMFEIDSTAERLKTSIRQFTDFSRNVAHELRTPLTQLRAILESAQPEENQQILRVRTENNATVMGDYQLIAQLVSNLVENAVRYAGEGARITVSTHGQTIQVEDDGPGIPEADREKVFEPFFKCETARNSRGTGLGLALVKAIVEHHGARITIGLTSKGNNVISVQF